MYPTFTPSPHITLSSYLLWMCFTFSLCVYYFYRRAYHNSLSGKYAAELSIWIMVGGFLGARFFHIALEYPEYYWNHPVEIFKFWKGGFVFFGGFFGALIASAFFAKLKHQIFTRWLDHAAPVAALGYGVGRIGCFLAGCCYGKFCELPWAVSFGPGVEAPTGLPLHPTQIYAFLGEILIFGILMALEYYRPRLRFLKENGTIFYTWMILHGLGRLFLEQFRADFRGPEFEGYSPSTYISLALIGAGLSLLVKAQPKKLLKK